MSSLGIPSPVADAAARTAAAGTARLLAAWRTGSPLPEAVGFRRGPRHHTARLDKVLPPAGAYRLADEEWSAATSTINE